MDFEKCDRLNTGLDKKNILRGDERLRNMVVEDKDFKDAAEDRSDLEGIVRTTTKEDTD